VPPVWFVEAVYQPQERGLSSAARSDNGDEFSGRDFDADAGDQNLSDDAARQIPGFEPGCVRRRNRF
jgi:hypothetical protein